MPVKVIGPGFGAVTTRSPGASASGMPIGGAWSSSKGGRIGSFLAPRRGAA